MSLFTKATRSQVFLKLAITGPSGSGKTFSALRLATGLLAGTGKRIAVIDTENESASLYSEQFDFDTLALSPPFEHAKFSNGVVGAVDGGYGAVIIDSGSHFWEGILEYKAKLDSSPRPGSNSYTNWNEAGKKFSDILTAVLHSKIHVIVCLRSKMDYILEENGKGKMQPKKVGLAPIMRDGIEYEFSTVLDVALNHECVASKDRTGLFTDKIFQITEETGKSFANWLSTATPASAQSAPITQASAPSGVNPMSATWEGVTIVSMDSKPGKGNSAEIWHKFKFFNNMEGITKDSSIVTTLTAAKQGTTFDVSVILKSGIFHIVSVTALPEK